MTGPSHSPAGQLDARRLWSGGVATAVVAALIAVVGILVARGLLDVAVLAPQGDGLWGDASTMTYALVAGGVALAATGLLQLLAATTPRFQQFFTWVMMLLTAVAVVLPLSLQADTGSKVTTAVINLVLGLSVTGILNGVARSARRRSPGSAATPGASPPWQST